MVWPHPRLLLTAAVVSFCSNWQFAFQITYVNTSVKTFYELANEGYRTTKECSTCWLPEESWTSAWSSIVSAFYPGTILGFLMIPTLTSRFGVKRTQLGTCIAALLGCGVHFLSYFIVTQGAGVFSIALCIGRFLIGMQAGSSLCLLPLYILEISPRQYRAFLSTFQQVSQATGTLLGLLIGSEEFIPLGTHRFIWLQVFAVAPTVLFISTLLITPKTPHQKIREKAKQEEVMECIKWYHGQETNVEEIRDDMAEEGHPIEKSPTDKEKRPPITWATWKGFMIGGAAAISYAFTADDLVDTFSAQIITKSNSASTVKELTNEASDIISVFMGLILLVSSLFGTVLIDRFGRRNLLLLGLFGTAVSNSVVVLYPTNEWVVTVGFSFTKAFIGLGAGAPAWFLTSELVAHAHVSLFQSLSTGLLLTFTMLVTFFFLQLDLLVGSYSIFILSSGPSFILAFLLFLFLPETKNKTVAQVQEILATTTFSGIQKPPKKENNNRNNNISCEEDGKANHYGSLSL